MSGSRGRKNYSKCRKPYSTESPFAPFRPDIGSLAPVISGGTDLAGSRKTRPASGHPDIRCLVGTARNHALRTAHACGVPACGCRPARRVVRFHGFWTRGNRASSRVPGRVGRERALQSNGNAVFAGWPALRRAAGRAVTCHQERGSPLHAIPHADRECIRRTRIARRRF